MVIVHGYSAKLKTNNCRRWLRLYQQLLSGKGKEFKFQKEMKNGTEKHADFLANSSN